VILVSGTTLVMLAAIISPILLLFVAPVVALAMTHWVYREQN
jgi:uncharacterized membrane protein YvlD (DUF360 family)